MSGISEFTATLILISITGFLIWTILSIRQRRIMELSSGESNYIGNAKDPSTLIEPDDEALENLAELLEALLAAELITPRPAPATGDS